MTIDVANSTLSNTFDFTRNRVNELAAAMTNKAITVNSNAAVGNAFVTGTFRANTLFTDTLSGGNNSVAAALTISTNTSITGFGRANTLYADTLSGGVSGTTANLTVSTNTVFSANGYFNNHVLFGNSTVYILANSTALVIPATGSFTVGDSTVNVTANSTVLTVADGGRVTVGNSTVNTTANSTHFATVGGTFLAGNSTVFSLTNATVHYTTGTFYAGNSTVNTTANSTQIKTGATGSLVIGNSTVNATMNSTVLTINTGNFTTITGLTSLTGLGSLMVGNSTVNTTSDGSFVNVANSTSNSTLTMGKLTISNGTVNTTINSTAFAVNGSVVWHSGNDGSGSGMDTDLVRGHTPGTFGLTLLDTAARKEALAAVKSPVAIKTSTFTVANSDIGTTFLCSGSYAINLPAAGASDIGNGFAFYVRNTSTGVLTLTGNSTNTIESSNTYPLYAKQECLVVADGNSPGDWKLIGLQKNVHLGTIDIVNGNFATADLTIPLGYYDFLLDLYDLSPLVNDAALFGRVSNDGGTTFATSSYFGGVIMGNGSPGVTSFSKYGPSGSMGFSVSSSNSYAAMSTTRFNPGITGVSNPNFITNFSGFYQTSNVEVGTYYNTYSGSTTRITHLRLLQSSGNIKNMTARLYGRTV
jgi:hypothetical protein